MYQLAGEYDCKIDAKGRLKLPSGLLKQLGDMSLNFTLNRGFETHLMLYPESEWLKKTKEIDQKLLFAYQKQVEIWAKNRYEAIISEEPVEFADIADRIFSEEEAKRDE